MKMQRGELVGFQGCLGYDYHPEDKSISIEVCSIEFSNRRSTIVFLASIFEKE